MSDESKNTITTAPWRLVPGNMPRIVALAICPSDAAVVYALPWALGASSPALKSTDGGLHWNPTGPKPVGFSKSGAQNIAIARNNPDVIYCGSYGAVFKSTDGGVRWTASALPRRGMITALAVSADGNTVYAGGLTSVGLFKSTDAAETWIDLGGWSGCECIAIDPTNEDRVYIARYVNGDPRQGGVIESTDAGAHWHPTAPMLTGPGTPVACFFVTFTAAGTAFAVVRGTPFREDTSPTWEAKAIEGSGVVQAARIGVDPRDGRVVYASTDHGIYKSTDAAESWFLSGLSDVKDVALVAVSPSDGRVVYASNYPDLWVSVTAGE